jgi:LysR family transcriptional regulator for bpeEF and oprC
MDRIQAMSVFVRVVDTGGFTRAAEMLRMPKATVTTLVQQLEGHLGVKLLNRTTRRVSVTADGAAYYERCVRILAEIDETETGLRRTHGTISGRLRVDVPATFGRRVLMPALPDFVRRYPDVRLEVGCGDRPVDLIEEGVDCVVRGGDPGDESLVARRVGELHFICCATRGYLAEHGEPTHPRDLERHRCVNYFSPKTGRMYPWDFTRDGERIELALDGPVASNDSEAYIAAGLAGLGIFQAIACDVREGLESGEVRRILADWRAAPLPIFVMYPQNRHLSAKVRAFVDWVADLVERQTAESRQGTAGLAA